VPSPFQVSGGPTDVVAAIQAWLDGSGLTPPDKLSIRVKVGPVEVPKADPRPAFRQGAVVIRSGGETTDGVLISWDLAGAIALLDGSTLQAKVILSPEACDRLPECLREFGIVVLIFLLRRVGWHHVHAATALDPSGRGWLLAGNTQAGKSTTAAYLASRGWAVGCDDIAFLARDGDSVVVHAIRSTIALRPGGQALLARQGGVPFAQRDKTLFTPEELGGHWISTIHPDLLLFTTVGTDRTSAEAIHGARVLAELVRWSAWVALEPALAQSHLDLLNTLARQARSFRVILGQDLFRDPSLLDTIIPS
jgi:hypothetical protein